MSDTNSQIDFDHIHRYVGDDPALISEVLGLFKNQIDMWSPNFDVSMPDESWGMMMHSLKGTAHAIGAVKLAAYCEEAEALVGDGRRSGSRTVKLEKIESAIAQIMIEIQRWEYRQTIKQMKSGN